MFFLNIDVMVTWVFLRVLPNLFEMMGLTYHDHIRSSCAKAKCGFGSQIMSSVSPSHYKSFFFNGQSLCLSTCRTPKPRTLLIICTLYLWSLRLISKRLEEPQLPTLITSIRHRKRLINAEKCLLSRSIELKTYRVVLLINHFFGLLFKNPIQMHVKVILLIQSEWFTFISLHNAINISFRNKKVLKWTNWWLLKQNELYRSVYFFTSLYFL